MLKVLLNVLIKSLIKKAALLSVLMTLLACQSQQTQQVVPVNANGSGSSTVSSKVPAGSVGARAVHPTTRDAMAKVRGYFENNTVLANQSTIESLLNKAQRVSPQYADVYCYYGRLRWYQERLPEAENLLKRCISLLAADEPLARSSKQLLNTINQAY